MGFARTCLVRVLLPASLAAAPNACTDPASSISDAAISDGGSPTTDTTSTTSDATFVLDAFGPIDAGGPDADGDGLSDADESRLGTNPSLPDSDGDGLSDGAEVAIGTNPNLQDTDGDGRTDGAEVLVGTDPRRVDDACAADRYDASLGEKPADIIFVIDNSGSMELEIESVERNINESFADIIRNSGVDFRVIVLSQHGDSADRRICIREPLSTTNCEPVPARPANTDQFYHYSENISSHDSFVKILETYDTPDQFGLAPDGWQAWLRPEAFKVFVEITDDDPSGRLPDRPSGQNSATAANFEAALFALDPPHFGQPGQRNYIFHSIVGLVATSSADPWTESDPVQRDTCPTGVDPGVEYQALSIATRGLRYPVCSFESYDAIFRAAAQSVIATARIGCALDLPDAPAGQTLNLSTIAVEWTPAGGPTRLIPRASQAGCVGDGFFLDGDMVRLCAGTCAEVEVASSGTLAVVSGCGQPGADGGTPDVGPGRPDAGQGNCVPTSPTETACANGLDDDCDGFFDIEDIDCLL
ncbi:MAG: hypothetical protein HY791_18040 [Deltaproteobacteria bacterium]|nr:hypothetical protein [Deltaproteobacteria bacterium]